MGQEAVETRVPLMTLSDVHLVVRAEMHHGTAQSEHDLLIMQQAWVVENLIQCCHHLPRYLRPICTMHIFADYSMSMLYQATSSGNPQTSAVSGATPTLEDGSTQFETFVALQFQSQAPFQA